MNQRKDGPRYPSGGLISGYLTETCACGAPRKKGAAQCRACWKKQSHARQLMHSSVRRCITCGRLTTHQGCTKCDAVDQSVTFRCEYCGVEFWRNSHGKHEADTRRFCSKTCSGATRTAVADAIANTAKTKAALEREFARNVRHALQEQLRVVAPPSYKGVNRRRRVLHVCPDCGTSFHAPMKYVFCSRRCDLRYSKKDRPSLGSIPIHDRNQIASLMALVRAANRRIQDAARP